MNTINTLILAAPNLGAEGVETFWTTEAGKFVGMILGVVGIAVLIVAAIRAVKHFSDQKTGAGVKVLLGGALVSAFLFRPSLLETLAGTVGDIFEKVVNSVGMF